MALVQSDIIERARGITGNKESRIVGELGVPDSAIEYALRPVIRDLNAAYGTTSGLKEVTFTTVADQQDYPLAGIAADIASIEHVLRDRAHVPDAHQDEGWIDPRTGQGTGRQSIMDPGLMGGAFDVLVGQTRSRRNAKYGYEVIGTNLRLFPCPVETGELVVVRYVVSGYSIATLPDDAEHAVVMAACVAILNGQLNRMMSDRATGANHGLVSEDRIKLLRAQRDYYQQELSGEMAKMARMP